MQRLLLKLCLVLFGIITAAAPLFARASADTAYIRTINERADKIITELKMSDPAKASAVKEVIVQQYFSLNDIQNNRDSAVKTAKATIEDKNAADLRVKTIRTESEEQTNGLHKTYIDHLNALLAPDQVNKVKDAMTYSILPKTYGAYLDMLPNLTDEQKKQIMVWLTEAREHAMDAESSQKKHEWFGKYKGRINNYLSAAGIDMKKEGEAWQARIKARSGQ